MIRILYKKSILSSVRKIKGHHKALPVESINFAAEFLASFDHGGRLFSFQRFK